MSKQNWFKGKTVVITGSTSGIGLGMAHAFAGKGANIVLNGLGEQAQIESQKKQLRSKFGIAVEHSPANMLRPLEIIEMINFAHDRFGSVDILVNNAGVQHVAPIEVFPEQKWDEIVAILLSATFHAIKAVVPIMKSQPWGRIINTASVHSLVASPYKVAYVAAKHGVAGLTKTVALELAETNITVNAIAPGYVETPLVTGQIKDTARARGITTEEVIRDVMLCAQPNKQLITIEQVAKLAVFLCEQQASAITGAILPIDGGWTAG